MRAWLLALVLLADTAVAHPDLDLQIEALSQDIRARPEAAGLYLERADLYRRHGDWASAQADFDRVRSIDPDHPELDWREGHTLVDAGRLSEGEAMLSRFLQRHPGHAAALEVRARARSLQGRHRESARDFAAVIALSGQPAPVLFTRQAIELLAMAPPDMDTAQVVLEEATARFPGEVSLLGLAVDLALAREQDGAARQWLDRASPSLQALPRWAFRRHLLDCIEGAPGAAVAAADLLRRHRQGLTRTDTWEPPPPPPWPADTPPDAAWCRQAARTGLAEDIRQRLAPPDRP